MLVLAACDKLAGFESVSYVAPDAAPDLVTGDDHNLIAGLGSNGPTEVPAPADTVIEASLLDGTALQVQRSSDGSFSFPVPVATRYRFSQRDSDQSIAAEAQTDTRSIALRRRFFARPDATPATMETLVIIYEAATPVTNDYAAVAATGVRAFANAGGVSSGLLDWSSTPYGLVSAAKGDRFYWLHYQEQGPLQYYAIIETDQPMVEMQDGMPTMIGTQGAPDTPVSLAQDRCVHMKVPAATEYARLVTGTAFTSPSGVYWDIYSMSAAAFGPGGGLPVAQASQPLTTDTEFDVAYGSPFPGESDVSLVQVYGERDLHVEGSVPLKIENVELFFDQVPAGSTCATTIDADTTPLALLDTATLAGTLLSYDAQPITIDRAAPLQLDYTLKPGASDYVNIELFEVLSVGPMPGYTAVVPVRRYIAPSPVLIDPSLLVRNHYYIFAVTVQTGYPGGAQLDFRTATYPWASAAMYTTMFRVAN